MKEADRCCTHEEQAMNDKLRRPVEMRVDVLLKAHQAGKGADDRAKVSKSEPSNDEHGEEAALFMSLLFEPVSDEVCAFMKELTSRVALPARGPRQKIVQAVRLVVADLMRCIAEGEGAYLYRPLGSNTFVGSTVGHKPFCTAYKALAEQGLLIVELGRVDFGSGLKRTATRFYPTAALVDLAKSFGIEPTDFDRHFSPLPRAKQVRVPITLRKAARKAKITYGRKIVGDPMPVDFTDAKVAAFSKQVDEVNDALAGTDIQARTNKGTIVPHVGFQRSFNQGDLPGVHYDRGGRLFAVHGGYQNLSQEERALMTIGGEPVVECDISASHLTITMSLLKMKVESPSKLYIIPGIPRVIVKLYVNASLGNGKPLSRWPDDAVDDYAFVDTEKKKNRLRAAVEDEGCTWSGNLRQDWPIAKMKREVLTRFPLLHVIEKEGISWGVLQFEESCVIVGAVHDLCCRQGIPALPVHDSIICRASDASAVEHTIKRLFAERFGVVPDLKFK